MVVAGTSAATLHGIGDFWPTEHQFVSSRRRQTQRPQIRYRQRNLTGRDVTLIEGLPTMTLERTIADLVEEVGDLSLVADALRDAARKRPLDLERLKELLGPQAERSGFKKGDGETMLQRLLTGAGLDTQTVARHAAAHPAVINEVLANVVQALEASGLGTLNPAALHTFSDLFRMDSTRLQTLLPALEFSLQIQTTGAGLLHQFESLGVAMEESATLATRPVAEQTAALAAKIFSQHVAAPVTAAEIAGPEEEESTE